MADDNGGHRKVTYPFWYWPSRVDVLQMAGHPSVSVASCCCCCRVPKLLRPTIVLSDRTGTAPGRICPATGPLTSVRVSAQPRRWWNIGLLASTFLFLSFSFGSQNKLLFFFLFRSFPSLAFYCVFIDFPGFCGDFTVLVKRSTGFYGFPWVLPGFTGFRWFPDVFFFEWTRKRRWRRVPQEVGREVGLLLFCAASLRTGSVFQTFQNTGWPARLIERNLSPPTCPLNLSEWVLNATAPAVHFVS